ncbi:MAG: hypothetical protein WEA04_04275 [Candidatus Andersenbacteria bacterium]
MPAHVAIPRRALVASAGILLGLIFASMAYTRLPQATIIVRPATYEREVTQEITLSQTSHEPDFVRYILPAKLLEKEVTETKTFKREGQKTFEDLARGTVKIINKQAEEQRLLPKSHLRHEGTGIFFLTDAAVVVPPLGEVSVAVTAKEKGLPGNVTPGTFIIDKLPASAQKVVYAESSTTFSGGVSGETPLTEEEISRAKEEVDKQARGRIEGELTAAAGGALTRPDLVTMTTVEESVSAAAGSKTTEFTVQKKIKARGFFPDDNDLLSLTLLALRSAPKPDEEFMSYKPESFTVSITRSDFTRGEARVKGTLTGVFASKAGPALFSADNLAGRSAAEVQEYFQQFPSVESVEVQFSPFWVKSVPARPEATEIVVGSIN